MRTMAESSAVHQPKQDHVLLERNILAFFSLNSG